MNKYFQELNRLPQSTTLTKMRELALNQKVPIIDDEGLVFLLFLVKTKKVRRILEIGTAIGFSAINMAMISREIFIETLEKDESLYRQALENIEEAGLTSQITVIHADALLYNLENLEGDYDLIFIDAAKAQYQKFFTKYTPLLAKEGIVVTDNLLFHGLVNDKEKTMSKNTRHLVNKIDNYNHWLTNHPDFNTSFFALGDGMAVSQRREE
ncbi:MAG TPA: O-methyltransferase [Bacilli bacterium]|nr:O-methyltransferase [Bacilli bacterium]